MPRYFLELAYKGTSYSGFQKQENANTIQAEVEKAFEILHGHPVSLSGSSRTDAGVHALQNYFHFDFDGLHPQFIYKINAILPGDIVVKKVHVLHPGAHSRFDAISRKYEYHIYTKKNPFLQGQALFYPYKIDVDLVQHAVEIVKAENYFFSFCKTNSQVKNFECIIFKSEWLHQDDKSIFMIEANRFLRGMVRLLTASLLQVGRKKISLEEFSRLFRADKKCGFSVPPHGLYLTQVVYPDNYFF
jgi:tRNA pseudouridine38-40 synthase